jgi:5-methylcytosine-specific restriction enzyme B
MPVQPGWHDPSSLLGYVNPLVSDTYVRTGFLDFLLRAAGDPSRPYTIVLDEMNLSHPEQYLAPLLSAMETGETIEFHTSEEEMSGVPPSIPYPANLVLVGTVNMDETTHGLSDKVLDRACVIDFWDVDVAAWPSWGTTGLTAEVETQARELLTELGATLRPVRLHFGWRTIDDVVGYVRFAASSGMLESTQALDHAIYGKVLPKLRGEDTERLRKALAKARDVLKVHGLNDSAEKVEELANDLAETGSARFWR